MLIQRVLTAAVLLLLLVPALLIDAVQPFAVLMMIVMAAAGWEWGRLAGLKAGPAVLVGVGIALLGAISWLAGWAAAAPPLVWWLAAALWVLGGAQMLRLGPAGWLALPRALRIAIGLLVLWVAWMALAAAKVRGPNFVLSVFCLVWVADVMAYAGGRTFGKRKLAPTISPGKSWEGVYTGVASVVVVALLWVMAERHWDVASASVYGMVFDRGGAIVLVISVVFMAAISVVGDLFESLVKRAVGAKDSSSLLPGHGGVLDRIDALLPVFPVAMALTTL